MSWKQANQEKPREGQIVICLFSDVTKELLAFIPSGWSSKPGHWVDQHGDAWEGEEPIFWHPLPEPPPIDWVPDEVFSGE